MKNFDNAIAAAFVALKELDAWFNSRSRDYKHFEQVRMEFEDRKKEYYDLINKMIDADHDQKD